jgi:hypothetical protein
MCGSAPTEVRTRVGSARGYSGILGDTLGYSRNPLGYCGGTRSTRVV